MSEMRPRVWIADLVRALVALDSSGNGLDKADVVAVKQMLGMAPAAPVARDRAGPVVPPAQDEDLVAVHAVVDEEPERDPPDGETQLVQTQPRHERPGPQAGERVTALAGLRPSYNAKKIQPWHTVAPLPTADTVRKQLPFKPLLRPDAARGIVQTALSRPEPDGEIDIDAVVAELSAARPIRVLPKLSSPTMRFGVQMLLDRSNGMHPFLADQQDLLEQVRLVFGGQATSVWSFNASPEIGRSDTGATTYEPVRCGQVMVVSSFGIAAEAEWYSDPDEWAAMVDLWRRRGTEAVALVPFPRSRFPRWLKALMPVVTWDRDTTVGTVRSAFAAGAR